MENKSVTPNFEALTENHIRNKKQKWWIRWCIFFVTGLSLTILASREFLPDNIRLMFAVIGLPLLFISIFLISMTKFGRYKWSGDPWIP